MYSLSGKVILKSRPLRWQPAWVFLGFFPIRQPLLLCTESKKNTCRRKQKQLKADKDLNGRLVGGRRRRRGDKTGDKQLKKHKNRDKKAQVET